MTILKPIAPHSLPWTDPLAALPALAGPDGDCVFLHSSQEAPDGGRYSFCATHPRDIITGDSLNEFAARLSVNAAPFENAWFGTLTYELRHAFETLSNDAPGDYAQPPLWMARFGRIYCFDHIERTLTCWSDEGPPEALPAAAAKPEIQPRVQALSSNMTKSAYLEKVRALLDAIHRGDLYQANLTRKFMGRIENADAMSLFQQLCRLSPARYSAFLRMGGVTVCSSSPERFLTVTPDRCVLAQPIKGSAPRHADAAADEASRRALETSAKDRAENLMIVDLMRNDLSRVCEAGSVTVERLFEVTSYATVHHMASAVRGRLRDGVTAADAVAAAFPPGSMTGAPKIRAMNACTELENKERGIYSGAIGWFGGDGSCDLSVVIRTLILYGDRFEFQVGGGIVADSDPESEWRETLVKARAIARLLHIRESEMEAL